MSSFVRVNRRVGASKSNPTQPSAQTPPAASQSTHTSTPVSTPIELSRDARLQQKVLKQATAKANIIIPNGCKPWVSSQILTSTGIRDIDSLLGGGIPLGTICLIINDARTKYTDVYTRTHLRYGYTRHQRTIIISSILSLPQLHSMVNKYTRGSNPSVVPTPSTSNSSSSSSTVDTPASSSTSKQQSTGSKISSGIDEDEDIGFSSQPSSSSTAAVVPTKTDPEQEPKVQQRQGAMIKALHDETKKSQLTIAWQYDKYKNSNTDDSNLAGVDDQNDDNDDGDMTTSTHDDDDDDDGIYDNDDNNIIDNDNTTHATSIDYNNIKQQLKDITLNKDAYVVSVSRGYDDWNISSSLSLSSPPSQPPPSTSSKTLEAHLGMLLQHIISIIHEPLAPRHMDLGTTDQVVPVRIVIDIFHDILLYDESSSSSSLGHISSSSLSLIVRFCHHLRSIASTNNAIITYIIPSTSSSTFINTLLSLSDMCFSLKPFGSSIKPSPAAEIYPTYDGLLLFHKLPRINTIHYSYKLPNTLTFLFKERPSIGFAVSPLVLPPEMSRTSAQETQHAQKFKVFDSLLQEAVQDLTQKVINKTISSTDNTDSNTNDQDKQQQQHQSASCQTCGQHLPDTPSVSPVPLSQRAMSQSKQNNDFSIPEGNEEDEDDE